MEASSPGNAADMRTEALRAILYRETGILDALIHDLANADVTSQRVDPDVVRITALMLQALGVSLHSVLRLTEGREMSIRDAYGIARSASELAVNICYIAVGGGEVAGRAERHALQKSYRDLHRTGAIGGVSFDLRSDWSPDVDRVPGLRDALAEFTGRKGQEINDWTPLNISRRIASVAKMHAREIRGHNTDLIPLAPWGVSVHLSFGETGNN